MDEIERERMMSEIHLRHRRQESGIVREWHQVEMRRRYELEWERLNAIERARDEDSQAEENPNRIILPVLVGLSSPEPVIAKPLIITSESGALGEILAQQEKNRKRLARNRELVKERKYREYQEVLLGLSEEERKALAAHLERYGRTFPKTAKSLSKQIYAFRSFRQYQQSKEDELFFEKHRALETLWTLEMRVHSREAYLPFRICDRPFHLMKDIPMLYRFTPKRKTIFPKIESSQVKA